MTDSNPDSTNNRSKTGADTDHKKPAVTAAEKKYLELLLAMREEFETRRVAIRKDIRGGLSSDSKERAVQLENADTLNALLDEAELQVEQIDHAIKRIDDGRFGVCEACGAQIQESRLQAFPQTAWCITCAARNT